MTLLSVRNLSIAVGARNLVEDVDLDLREGEVLGLVGESGSGKTVTCRALMRLLPENQLRIAAGSVSLKGRDLVPLSEAEMRKVRGVEIGMIFQNPSSHLDPVMRIGEQIAESVRYHEGAAPKEAMDRAIDLLRQVGIPDPASRVAAYPHEFSGGMRQRAMIAMALSCEPELLIADEPTTALDVTIQAQILELIKKLKRETGTSVILITHDLGVVAGMTDHVIVMYAGKIFEQASTKELFAVPGNPYTKGLLRSVPDPTAEQGKLYQIPGLPPDVVHLKPGCPFAQRCDYTQDICTREFPPFVQLNADHYSLCHFAREVYSESGGTPV